MDLTTAFREFSDLLEVSARALQAMIRVEQTAAADMTNEHIEEVAQIAERLRAISAELALHK